MSGPASHSPLITHSSPQAIVAWRSGTPISAQRLLSDAHALAARLPEGKHILNVCHDRYHFTVGLAAALMRGKITLLPSTLAAEMVEQLQQQSPDLFYLTDSESYAFPLPSLHYTEALDSEVTPYEVPLIANEQLVARVFTSGSTGAPQPHDKHWGSLVRNVQAEASLMGLDDGRHHTIIGTVPAQHMYGFESTVMLALQSGQALSASRPFYPADIIAAIESTPHPRLLVTTPFHLKSLMSEELELPSVERIICATAPLSLELARQAEQRLNAPLQEIYGCTETGQIATRRATLSDEWQLFPEVHLHAEGETVWASGGHVETPVAMNDLLELLENGRFRLHGRTADLINIAGKRSSLAYLNHQLAAIPGVVDGTFFMPDEENIDGVTRLTLVVVAPTLNSSTLLHALRNRIDPAFMPRPVLFVDSLPRSANGKLPRQAVQNLILHHQQKNEA